MLSKNSLTYFLSIFAIAIWWLAAFKNPVATETLNLNSPHETTVKKSIDYKTDHLLKLDREEICKALNGDVVLMGSLIAQWELDSEILEYHGLANVKRLDRDDYLKSQLLSKTLLKYDESTLDVIREKYSESPVIDSMHRPFDCHVGRYRFLPQTFVSAGILLALVDVEQIVALPKGLRRHKHIYPTELTDQVDTDIDSFHTEKIFMCDPDLAFVAQHYSHPGTLDALNDQGIEMFSLDNIESVTDIQKFIRSIGHLCHRPLKADLLSIFIDSALNAIDNKRLIANKSLNMSSVMVVNYHTHYSLPGTKTLTSQLLKRMGINQPHSLELTGEYEWSVPIQEEKIIQQNPEHLLIITLAGESNLDYFYQTNLSRFTSAGKLQQIRVLDDNAQQTLSQHIVLAYYDLNHALVDLYE